MRNGLGGMFFINSLLTGMNSEPDDMFKAEGDNTEGTGESPGNCSGKIGWVIVTVKMSQ